MMHNFTAIGEEQKTFTIEVRLTSKCNYSCYYCTDLHYNKVPFVIHNVKNLCRLINDCYDTLKKSINIYIYGGEPTLYPYLDQYLQTLLQGIDSDRIKIHIDIQTNLSLRFSWWQSFCEKYSKYSHILKVCCSYHNTQTAYSQFIKKCLLLKTHNLLGIISFMYNKHKDVIPNFNLTVKLFGGYEHCEICPLMDSRLSQPLLANTDELLHIEKQHDIQQFKHHSFFFNETIPIEDGANRYSLSRFDFWKHNLNSFTGYSCAVAFDKLVMDWDGNCFYCESHMFSNAKPLFNINDKTDYKKYFSALENVTCSFSKCFFNIENKKIRNDDGITNVHINDLHKDYSINRITL